MILIFSAFDRELTPFRRKLVDRKPIAIAGLHGIRGRLGDTWIATVSTGIGRERARESARCALDAFPDARIVISSGVAGGLSHGLAPGDLVVADRLILDGEGDHAADQIVAIDAELVRRAGQILHGAGLRFVTGAILTASRVLADSAAKHAAKDQSGAIAVDMESAAVGLEVARRGLPFLCVRAVLDALDDEVVGAHLADAHGRIKPLAATAFLIRNPGSALKLPRMMGNLGRATRALASALEALAGNLPTTDHGGTNK
jgi:adenosylhomocysteine nucleosidase